MNTIFDELFYGEPCAFTQPLSEEYQAKKQEFADLDREVDRLLTTKLKNQIFERDSALEDILRREAFAAGVRLGGRFMLELLAAP
jgi:hypothetical protein